MKYSPSYTCLFQGAQWFLENGGRDAIGGNGKSVIMDAALLMGDDPYRYPDNLPIVNATGGPGGKPSCGSLPDPCKNFPVKYLVTDTGFGTGLDVRPNPGIGFPGIANYFPVTKANPGTAEDPLPRRPGAGPAAALPRAPAYGAPRFAPGRDAALSAAARAYRQQAMPGTPIPGDNHERYRPRPRAGGAVHRDLPGLHVRARDGVRTVPVRRHAPPTARCSRMCRG